jgi:hypothetical protein
MKKSNAVRASEKTVGLVSLISKGEVGLQEILSIRIVTKANKFLMFYL